MLLEKVRINCWMDFYRQQSPGKGFWKCPLIIFLMFPMSRYLFISENSVFYIALKKLLSQEKGCVNNHHLYYNLLQNRKESLERHFSLKILLLTCFHVYGGIVLSHPTGFLFIANWCSWCLIHPKFTNACLEQNQLILLGTQLGCIDFLVLSSLYHEVNT